MYDLNRFNATQETQRSSPKILYALAQIPLASPAATGGCGGGGMLGLFRGRGTGRGRGSEPDWKAEGAEGVTGPGLSWAEAAASE